MDIPQMELQATRNTLDYKDRMQQRLKLLVDL